MDGVLESDTNQNPDETNDLDPQQLCQIGDQHHAKLLLIARSISSAVANQSAEDAVQEAFVELAKQEVMPDDALSWMVRVVRNRMLDWIRRDHRRQQREMIYSQQPWFVSSAETTPVDPFNLSADELSVAIGELAVSQRQVIVMHIWGGMTFKIIAETLAISPSTAHRHYQAAVENLRMKWTFESNARTSP